MQGQATLATALASRADQPAGSHGQGSPRRLSPGMLGHKVTPGYMGIGQVKYRETESLGHLNASLGHGNCVQSRSCLSFPTGEFTKSFFSFGHHEGTRVVEALAG